MTNNATLLSTRQTIYTLAKSIGVSPATVSRALRNDAAINHNTRQQIQSAARRMHFQPSPIARHLARGRTGLIALLVAVPQNPVFAALAGALIEAAQKTGHEVLVAYNPRDAQHERQMVESMAHAPADGVILVPRFGAESRQHLVALGACRT